MNHLKEVVRNIVLAKRRKHVPEDPKFWTCFYYEGHHPDLLHCTHKYFGDLNKNEISVVTRILDNHFENNPFKSFKVNFGKEEMFGQDKDVRVLVPTDNKNYDKFLIPLRDKLNKFKTDDYDKYRPHVTTNINKVDLPFKGYALMYGGEFLKKYE
jgi:2'-5' RNA ligase